VVFVATAAPVAAGDADDGPPRGDRRISVTGGVVVASGEIVDGEVVSIDGPVRINGTVNAKVFVGDGHLTIRGEVNGDVLVVHGDALITGRVDGDIVALDGRITTVDGAKVTGSVKSRRAPDVAPGTVNGDVKKLSIKNLLSGLVLVFLIYLWVAVTLSIALLGLLFVLLLPRGADATVAAGRRFWPTVGWGALIGIVGPIIGLLVLVTIVGIPFGLGIFSALNVLAPLGYVASSLILGRRMVKGTSTGGRIGAFFAGFGILRVLALIPAIGAIVWALVCIYGLGALAQAAWRAGRGTSDPQPVAPPADRPPVAAGAGVPTTAGAAPAFTEPSTREAPRSDAPD
jgi:cytoskeletal protein CcmA (bactofilin family)